jgi:uncharacterized protein YjiS (DUF1127 family)
MSSSTIEARASPVAGRGPRTWQVSPAQAIKRLVAWVRNERRIRRGIVELMSLDDRLLADIGLSRGDIEHAARYGRFPR